MAKIPKVLYGGQYLNRGDKIVSSDGVYELRMQTDGNLVIYRRDNKMKRETALWAKGSKKGNQFIMQEDGNAVLYDEAGDALWSSKTQKTGANRIIMQADGNLVIYDNNDKPKWASDTKYP